MSVFYENEADRVALSFPTLKELAIGNVKLTTYCLDGHGRGSYVLSLQLIFSTDPVQIIGPTLSDRILKGGQVNVLSQTDTRIQ